MARPLRRVIVGLSIRLCRSTQELEQLSMMEICEYVAMLTEMSRPAGAARPGRSSPQEIEAKFEAFFARQKE
jgi:hypothetical protein